MKNRKWYFLSTLSTIILSIISCANIQTPQGGQKDKNPPKIVSSYPPNYSKSFSSKKIEIDFDEYFDLKNALKEITISPAIKKNMDFKIKKKSLFIFIKDSLEKNSTYKINFGNSIVDINESNILKNYNYIFSTGEKIDSLYIKGVVFNSYTQKAEKDVTVILLEQNKDSLFTKKPAVVFCNTDSNGRFILSNLPNKIYNIFALKEQNSNRYYDFEEEEIAFCNKTINPITEKDSVKLFLFKEIPNKIKLKERKIIENGTIKLFFNKGIKKDYLDVIYPKDSIIHKIIFNYNQKRDSITIWIKNIQKLDSIKISLKEEDKKIDTLIFRRNSNKEIKQPIIITDNIINNLLKPYENYKIKTNIPIDKILNSSQIKLKEDSNFIKNFTLLRDTTTNINTTIKYNWQQNKKYQIEILDSTFLGINNTYNKAYKQFFTYNHADNYGNIILKVEVLDSSKHYIIELFKTTNNITVYSSSIQGNKYLSIKLLETGKYNVRIIEDENKNGSWDTGNLKEKKQAEKVIYFNKIINVKPNWDIEEKILIN